MAKAIWTEHYEIMWGKFTELKYYALSWKTITPLWKVHISFAFQAWRELMWFSITPTSHQWRKKKTSSSTVCFAHSLPFTHRISLSVHYRMIDKFGGGKLLNLSIKLQQIRRFQAICSHNQVNRLLQFAISLKSMYKTFHHCILKSIFHQYHQRQFPCPISPFKVGNITQTNELGADMPHI